MISLDLANCFGIESTGFVKSGFDRHVHWLCAIGEQAEVDCRVFVARCLWWLDRCAALNTGSRRSMEGQTRHCDSCDLAVELLER